MNSYDVENKLNRVKLSEAQLINTNYIMALIIIRQHNVIVLLYCCMVSKECGLFEYSMAC